MSHATDPFDCSCSDPACEDARRELLIFGGLRILGLAPKDLDESDVGPADPQSVPDPAPVVVRWP